MPATLTMLPRDLTPGCGEDGSEGDREVAVPALSWWANDDGICGPTLGADTFRLPDSAPADTFRLPEKLPAMELCIVAELAPMPAELTVAVLPGAALTEVVLPEAVLAMARSILELMSAVCSRNRCTEGAFLTAGPGPMVILGGAVEIPSGIRGLMPPLKGRTLLFSTRCQPPAAASPPFSAATMPPPPTSGERTSGDGGGTTGSNPAASSPAAATCGNGGATMVRAATCRSSMVPRLASLYSCGAGGSGGTELPEETSPAIQPAASSPDRAVGEPRLAVLRGRLAHGDGGDARVVARGGGGGTWEAGPGSSRTRPTCLLGLSKIAFGLRFFTQRSLINSSTGLHILESGARAPSRPSGASEPKSAITSPSGVRRKYAMSAPNLYCPGRMRTTGSSNDAVSSTSRNRSSNAAVLRSPPARAATRSRPGGI